MLIDRSLVEAALPGYAVEGDLGKGGYGLVLAGQHRLIGRKVAIKILLDTSDDPDLRARFLSEARVLAELDHPHIVRIHDYVEHQGTCLLVMELLSGGTLKQRMATGKLSPETICAIGIAASAALATAHSHGVLHRDVKPDNMMFDGAGLLKVTDFGIAKIFDGAETTASAILGTPRYMAPEQIMGGRLFPATDLYALAGVLYEMLADRPLFGRQMAVQPLTHHHLSVMPEPLTMVPAPISAVIMRTLAKEPGARFSDASELAQELAAAGTRSFGPGWFARSEVKVRVDDDIRAALGGSGTGMQSGAAPTVRASGGFPAGGPGGVGGPSYPPGPGQQGPGQPAGGGYRGQPQGGPPGQPHPGYPGTGSQLPGMSRPGQPGYSQTGFNQPGYNQPGHNQPGYGQPGYGQPGGSTPHPRPLQGPPSTTPAPGPLTPPGSTPQPRPVGPPPGSTPQPAPLGRPGPTRPFPGQPGQGGSNFGGQGWGGANAAPTHRPPAQNVPPGSQRPPGHRNQDSNDNSRTLIIAAVVFVLVVALTVGLVVALSGGGKDDGGDEVRSSPANAVAYSGAAVTVQGLSPYSLSIDDQGALLITSLATDRLQKISATGAVSDLAGTGSGGFSGDGGPATAAKLDGPGSAVTDGKGNIYIPDARNYRIRKIASDGTISTIAGTGVAGYSGDGGPATAAQLKSAEKLAVAPDGSIYVADYENHRIRKIGTDGIITTIAGTGVDGYSGEGGLATAATLNGPNDVEVASDGTLYIANLGSDTVQKINTDGTIHTVAGTGEQGYSGDGGPATKAQLSIPSVSLGSNGTLYIADYGNNRIRKVDANGTITTIAGTGSEGSSGDGGPATEAKFTDPSSVVEDSTGALYIADSGNNRIRRIAPDGTITTIAE
ncbi:serine/threonine protein kinase [Frankia sp. CcI49]|uniref:serine/threonine-protein kinase n=1 Tax=Frankia sp. CcI49 TaxID=1745382 RepID=UPI000975BA70|nr:serine/threonine-protein kinase [Frankia sp. CcI49]ONH57740.1 serine/threonine protein kinase [Frankia sp. CcI49]